MNKIIKLKREFKKYVMTFDISNENIKRKIYHTYRVMGKSKKIAKSLKLTKEQINIAMFIGLFHDIARFEQFKIYKTFNDLKSFDHGDYAIRILEDNKFIEKFTSDLKTKKIIIEAIRNHNKYTIDKKINDEELMFSKIIRDADKVDILYEAQNMFFKNKQKKYEVENGNISEYVMSSISNRKTVKRKENFCQLENLIVYLAFVFDLNYSYSFKLLKKNGFIFKIIKQFNFRKDETKKKMDEINKILKEYIKANT